MKRVIPIILLVLVSACRGDDTTASSSVPGLSPPAGISGIPSN
jgi:hypothetical protein